MVMAPGGQNPRPEIDPAKNKVGIRLTSRNSALEDIYRLRERVCYYETAETIGQRRPSNRKYNAYGALWYQPHMTLLQPGTRIDRDLHEIGAAFRSNFQYIRFDTFAIRTN
jgi:hypothetical protein